MVFLLSKWKSNADNSTEVRPESWESDTPEGDVNGIITHDYTETLPPNVVLDPEDTLSSESVREDDVYEETASVETGLGPDESTSDNETTDEPDYFWLENEGKRLSTSIKWNQLNPERKSDNSISYSVAGCDVTLTLAKGTRETYRDMILSKAETLNASVNEEIINYSPSRVTDMFEYDKYTLSYFKDEEQSVPVYAYYLVSRIDEDSVYLVTISSSEPIDDDSDMFGILEYSVGNVE